MFAMKLKNKILTMSLLITGLLTAAMPASAQSLIVDLARVEKETAASKDFALQTQELRTIMGTLNNYLERNGLLEQEAYELEKKKAVIGPQKYEEEVAKLRQSQANAQRNLQSYQTLYNRLYQEFGAQFERARAPILREILTERKAALILPKRVILANGPGLDITTEVIERIDAALPQVNVNVPPLGATQAVDDAEAETPAPAESQ